MDDDVASIIRQALPMMAFTAPSLPSPTSSSRYLTVGASLSTTLHASIWGHPVMTFAAPVL